MLPRRSSSLRWWRRCHRLKQVMFLLAAIPLFQLGACGTGINQVLGGVTNALPSLTYNAAQSVFLLPFELALELATGGNLSGNGSSGLGSSGLGSSGLGSSGLGTSNLGTSTGV